MINILTWLRPLAWLRPFEWPRKNDCYHHNCKIFHRISQKFARAAIYLFIFLNCTICSIYKIVYRKWEFLSTTTGGRTESWIIWKKRHPLCSRKQQDLWETRTQNLRNITNIQMHMVSVWLPLVAREWSPNPCYLTSPVQLLSKRKRRPARLPSSFPPFYHWEKWQKIKQRWI